MHQQTAMTAARILGLLVAGRSCALGNRTRRSDFSTLETPLAKPTSSQLVKSGRPYQRVFSASWELMAGTFVPAGASGKAPRRPHPPTWGAGRLETSWLVLFRAFGLGATQEGLTAIQRVAGNGTLSSIRRRPAVAAGGRFKLYIFSSRPLLLGLLLRIYEVMLSMLVGEGPSTSVRPVSTPVTPDRR